MHNNRGPGGNLVSRLVAAGKGNRQNFDINSKSPVNHSNMTPAEKAAVEYYNTQRRLRRLRENFSRQFKSFVVATYSIQPYGDAELESLLAQYVADPVLAQDLRQEVKKRQQSGALGVRVR
jgi:hypothetical protein